MPEPIHIRWIWPQNSRCTACTSTHWRQAGQRDRKQYRVCRSCGNGYFVLPVAEEVDDGGETSTIRPV